MRTTFSRGDWDARPPIRPAAPLHAEVVVVHHTTDRNDYTEAGAFALVRAIQDLHIDVNGWDDIGYNAVIDRFGRSFAGRAGVGAHTLGHNHRALGIALLGDFREDSPSAAALAELAELAWPLPLVHHRDLVETECPGAAFAYGAGVSAVSSAASAGLGSKISS